MSPEISSFLFFFDLFLPSLFFPFSSFFKEVGGADEEGCSPAYAVGIGEEDEKDGGTTLGTAEEEEKEREQAGILEGILAGFGGWGEIEEVE